MDRSVEEIKTRLEELNMLLEEEHETISIIQLIQQRSELLEELCDAQESVEV